MGEDNKRQANCANSIVGQRYLAVEKNLENLVKGNLPLTEKFIFNSVFDFREIKNSEKFKKLVTTDPDYKKLFSASAPGGYASINFDKKNLRFSLLYEKTRDKSEAEIYSRCFSEVIAITFAALGLDMSGLSQMSFTKEKNALNEEIHSLMNDSGEKS